MQFNWGPSPTIPNNLLSEVKGHGNQVVSHQERVGRTVSQLNKSVLQWFRRTILGHFPSEESSWMALEDKRLVISLPFCTSVQDTSPQVPELLLFIATELMCHIHPLQSKSHMNQNLSYEDSGARGSKAFLFF